MAARVDTLWALGWRCLPGVMTLFEELAAAIGTAEEARIVEAIYRVMPRQNFSTGLLQAAVDRVAVIELDSVLWSDWGNPERIIETLSRIGREPAFPLQCLSPEAPRTLRASARIDTFLKRHEGAA
jgi:mannose-1-phosphate guanylyltransferase